MFYDFRYFLISEIKTAIADSVKQFADLLKPFVRMDKISQINEELNI